MNQEVQIFEVLQELRDAEFRAFKEVLCQSEAEASAWALPSASREAVARHLVSCYGPGARRVAARTLDRLPARHLLDRLGEPPAREPPVGSAEPVVSQKLLMQLAQHVGREWRELGIMCLGLQQHQLDRLQEEYSTMNMRVFCMFQLWRNREKEKATITRLYQLLSHESISISPEALAVLLKGA